MRDYAIFLDDLILLAHLLNQLLMSCFLRQSIYYFCRLFPGIIVLQIFIHGYFVLCRVKDFRCFSEKSDVYSFGVFLLELVSGREAFGLVPSDINQNLVEWVYCSFPTLFCVSDLECFSYCSHPLDVYLPAQTGLRQKS